MNSFCNDNCQTCPGYDADLARYYCPIELRESQADLLKAQYADDAFWMLDQILTYELQAAQQLVEA